MCVDITNYFFTSDFNFGIAAIASSMLTFPRYNTIGKVILGNVSIDDAIAAMPKLKSEVKK
jgi:hypothetical protein